MNQIPNGNDFLVTSLSNVRCLFFFYWKVNVNRQSMPKNTMKQRNDINTEWIRKSQCSLWFLWNGYLYVRFCVDLFSWFCINYVFFFCFHHILHAWFMHTQTISFPSSIHFYFHLFFLLRLLWLDLIIKTDFI